MFKLLEAVTITHPLFEGRVGQIMDFGADGGKVLIKVNFFDKDDGINKEVFFDEIHIKKRRLING